SFDYLFSLICLPVPLSPIPLSVHLWCAGSGLPCLCDRLCPSATTLTHCIGRSSSAVHWRNLLEADLAALQHGFVAATIFGCDLGPNLTTVGSLATVLWLLILRQRNVDVSGLDYFKVGVVVTPLMLFVGALTIWLLL